MLNFKGVKALIFDLDGLIGDTEYYHNLSILKVMEEYGIKIKKAYLYKLVGFSTRENFLLLEKDFDIKLDIARLLKTREKVYLDIIKHSGIKAFPGVKELLVSGRQAGLSLAVGSSSARPQVMTVLRLLTASVGFKAKPAAIFDAIVTGSDVKRVKPAPDIFKKTANKLGLKPTECLVLEDSLPGVKAAKRAGMNCIAVQGRYGKNVNLSRADFTVKNLQGVFTLLKSRGCFSKV